MPRSPIRPPRPSLDLSNHLIVSAGTHPPRQANSIDESSQRDQAPVGGGKTLSGNLTSENLFGNRLPLEIEIGSGKGLFLASEAERNPNHNFLGIEIIRKYARHAAARLAKAELGNAKMISGNAEPLFFDRVPAESLEAVHVYFPDPWWKKRHRKRRVLNERSVADFFRAIRVGGRLHFWTDVLDYFEATIEMIAEIAPAFGVPIPEQAAEATHDLDYRTHFERRSRKNRIPVYRVRYEKRHANAP